MVSVVDDWIRLAHGLNEQNQHLLCHLLLKLSVLQAHNSNGMLSWPPWPDPLDEGVEKESADVDSVLDLPLEEESVCDETYGYEADVESDGEDQTLTEPLTR